MTSFGAKEIREGNFDTVHECLYDAYIRSRADNNLSSLPSVTIYTDLLSFQLIIPLSEIEN